MTTETLTAYQLANRYGLGLPDSPTSAGARFLLTLQDWALIAVDEYDADAFDLDHRAATIGALADDLTIFATNTLWAVFVDLGAWTVETADNVGGGMTGAALGALRLIARMVLADLLAEVPA